MKNFTKNIVLWIIVGLLLVALFNLFQGTPSKRLFTEISFSDFLVATDSGNVSEVNIMGNKIEGYFVDASELNVLKYTKIDLFVNIASMQEMTNEAVKDYFNIIKQSNAYFYCCNRENKKLYGGEELIFDKYSWGNCKKIVWEDCPWSKKYYVFSLPFIKKYDGNIKHALVKYS